MEQFSSEWHAWHDERLAALATPFGFLSITGLHCLDEGENTWDSAPGVFELSGDVVRFRVGTDRSVGPTSATLDLSRSESAEPGAAPRVGVDEEGVPWIRLGGAERSHQWLVSDHVAFEVLERSGRLGVRVHDSKSPLLQAFSDVPTFPLDTGWTTTGTFTAFPEPRLVPIATAQAGLEGRARTVGTVEFEIAGHTHRLTVTGSPETGLQVDFRDYTNGESTPDWRTLHLGVPDASGKVILDFNRTTIYPFAFLPWSTCPAPVPENMLAVAVTAGELKPLRTIGAHGINHPVGIIDLSRVPEVQHAVTWLSDAGADVIRFRVHEGVPLPGPIAADGFVVVGDPSTPDHADAEAVARVREFVTDSLAVGTPVLGAGGSGVRVVNGASRAGAAGAAGAAADGGDPGAAGGVSDRRTPDGRPIALLSSNPGVAEPPVVVSEDLAHHRLLSRFVDFDPETGLGWVDVAALAADSDSDRDRDAERPAGTGPAYGAGLGPVAADRLRVWFELFDRFAKIVRR